VSDFSYQKEEPLPELTKDARTWAMLCHLSALVGLMGGIAMFVGPLIIWLLKRDEHPFIDDQGKESLNFQISMLIYILLLVPLCCVMVGFFLLAALALANIVLVIIASIKANDGVVYRYPLTLRLIK
jgi:uncharacterized protein